MLKVFGHQLLSKGSYESYLLSVFPVTCFVHSYQLLVTEGPQVRPGLSTLPARLTHGERWQLDPRIDFGENTSRRSIPGQNSGDDTKPAADLRHAG